MDYQNRAGAKKGSGGLASAAQENLHRRKQVEDLLREGEEVPYSFQGVSKDEEELSKKNPYIYKNHAGRLVCKLCNTIHMSWSSVERHLEGKRHSLNLLKRGGSAESDQQKGLSLEESYFKQQVEELRPQIKNTGPTPNYQVAAIQDPATGYRGIAMKIMYNNLDSAIDSEDRPLVRMMSSLELPNESNEDKMYLAIAFEPFKTIALEIPHSELYESEDAPINDPLVDEFNGKCTFWDMDDLTLYVQLFFKN
ncbi:LADA_0B07932g1_1 [Lachancea dasiensis]|uniref:LADA_0B07932g1_1 n=1 Tax=Lachancea dasiensis TaxID=1072105 RepID=A0A1G4IU90_9SACH|nr:LADA_0B07932g1_1 [Lachancea dasiensis]